MFDRPKPTVGCSANGRGRRSILLRDVFLFLRAMSAVALATGRATLAGQVEVGGPEERGYPDPPGWVLAVRLTTSPCKSLVVTKAQKEAKAHPGL